MTCKSGVLHDTISTGSYLLSVDSENACMREVLVATATAWTTAVAGRPGGNKCVVRYVYGGRAHFAALSHGLLRGRRGHLAMMVGST